MQNLGTPRTGRELGSPMASSRPPGPLGSLALRSEWLHHEVTRHKDGPVWRGAEACPQQQGNRENEGKEDTEDKGKGQETSQPAPPSCLSLVETGEDEQSVDLEDPVATAGSGVSCSHIPC